MKSIQPCNFIVFEFDCSKVSPNEVFRIEEFISKHTKFDKFYSNVDFELVEKFWLTINLTRKESYFSKNMNTQYLEHLNTLAYPYISITEMKRKIKWKINSFRNIKIMSNIGLI